MVSYGSQTGIGAFRGEEGGPAGQAGPTESDRQLARLRAQQQGRGNGLDFSALSQIMGAQSGLQEPLPPLDFEWTWRTANQRGFKLTPNTARGGLGLQRGRLGRAHTRMSDSSLITHARDEIVLPFETVEQVNNQTPFANHMLLHSHLDDREVMAPYMTPGGSVLYAELSAADPTIGRAATFSDGSTIYSMGSCIVQGYEHLLIMGNFGALFLRPSGGGMAPLSVGSVGTFKVTTTTQVPNTDGGRPPTHGNGVGPGMVTGNAGAALIGLGWHDESTTEIFLGLSFIQSPLPGNPLIVRSQKAVLLVPIEPSEADANPYTQNASKMLSNVGLGAHQAIGFGRVGNLPPAGYFWEFSSGGPAAPGFRSRIASVNAYGSDYQVHQLSGDRILGAAFNRQRGGMVINYGDRVAFWAGKEEDMQIFSDEPPLAGYRRWAVAVASRDGIDYAVVNELPYAIGAVAQGRIRARILRFDWDLRTWSAVGEWTTLTEDGLIRWNNGIPIPVGDAPAGPYGYMTAYGAPDFPIGAVTRAMHNYAVQAYYTRDLNQSLPLSGSFDLTWFHKFEPPAATNPFSLRGGDRNYSGATGLKVRWPAFIFEPGYEYVDKYVDYIDYGGEDTGGAGSAATIRIGEGGTLDETNPPPLHHTFASPINHQDRRREFGRNQTSLLFPQVELELLRGTANLTPQGLPFTIYGHVDLPQEPAQPGWLNPGRSAG